MRLFQRVLTKNAFELFYTLLDNCYVRSCALLMPSMENCIVDNKRKDIKLIGCVHTFGWVCIYLYIKAQTQMGDNLEVFLARLADSELIKASSVVSTVPSTFSSPLSYRARATTGASEYIEIKIITSFILSSCHGYLVSKHFVLLICFTAWVISSSSSGSSSCRPPPSSFTKATSHTPPPPFLSFLNFLSFLLLLRFCVLQCQRGTRVLCSAPPPRAL